MNSDTVYLHDPENTGTNKTQTSEHHYNMELGKILVEEAYSKAWAPDDMIAFQEHPLSSAGSGLYFVGDYPSL